MRFGNRLTHSKADQFRFTRDIIRTVELISLAMALSHGKRPGNAASINELVRDMKSRLAYPRF